MQDAFGVERGLISKAEGTKWRLSDGERKAGRGNRKQQAATGAATVGYGAGLIGGSYAAARGADNLLSASSARGMGRYYRAESKKAQGASEALREAGNKKGAAENLRYALRHNQSAQRMERGAKAFSRAGKGKIALGAAAGAAGVGSLMAASNASSNRINAYRKSKGEKPRSKWTGFPKG